MDEKELLIYLYKYLRENYGKENLIANKDYLVAEGDIPVCLIAHMDTVFPEAPYEFYFDREEMVMWSPQGAGFDDRTGIAIILQILMNGYKPHVIFTSGEESGGIGARNLISNYPQIPFQLKPKFLIELDRQGENDSVFYCCDNKHFEKYINSFGFKTATGTFTDISILMPAWDICGVNFSVGYWDEHTKLERLDVDVMNDTYEKIINILEDKDLKTKKFKFKQKVYTRYIPNPVTSQDEVKCVCCDKKVPIKAAHSIYTGLNNTCFMCDECYMQYF